MYRCSIQIAFAGRPLLPCGSGSGRGGLATSITTQHTAQLTSMHDDVDGTFEFWIFIWNSVSQWYKVSVCKYWRECNKPSPHPFRKTTWFVAYDTLSETRLDLWLMTLIPSSLQPPITFSSRKKNRLGLRTHDWPTTMTCGIYRPDSLRQPLIFSLRKKIV